MSQIRRSIGSVPATAPTATHTTDAEILTRVAKKPIRDGEGEQVGVVTIRHYIREEEKFVTRLDIPEREFCFVKASGKKPDHFHARIMRVDVHLRDGLRPEDLKKGPVRVEVKTRKVDSTTGPNVLTYKYINAYPCAGEEESRGALSIARVAPTGSEVQHWEGDIPEGKPPGTIFLMAVVVPTT